MRRMEHAGTAFILDQMFSGALSKIGNGEHISKPLSDSLRKSDSVVADTLTMGTDSIAVADQRWASVADGNSPNMRR